MSGEQFAGVLERARAGDENAFAALYRDLQPALLRYLRVLSAGAAEDLAAETWLKVVKGLARFSGDEQGFRAWVLTIARYRYIDWIRTLHRRPLEALTPDLVAEPRSPSKAADQVAEENLSLDSALRLIAELPTFQAEVVVLRSVVGLNVQEVAGVVGRTPGAVRVSVHRGLRRLAELVEREQPSATGAVKAVTE